MHSPYLWGIFCMNRLKTNLQRENKLSRENLLDLLKSFSTREKAIEGLRQWIDDNSQEISEIYAGKWTIQQITARLTADIDSYGIKWSDAVIKPRKEPSFGGFVAKAKLQDKEVKPDESLLAMEKDLLKKINKEKSKGNVKKVMKLTHELIEIQKQQPQVGGSFG